MRLLRFAVCMLYVISHAGRPGVRPLQWGEGELSRVCVTERFSYFFNLSVAYGATSP